MVDEKEPLSPFRDLLFPHIFRSFRIAIQPSKLATAFAALTAIFLTGWLMDLNRTVIVTGQGRFIPYGRVVRSEAYSWTTELDAYLTSQERRQALLETTPPEHVRAGVFETLRDFVARQFYAAMTHSGDSDFVTFVIRCTRALVWAFKYHTIYSVVFFAIVLVILSLAGGAICRLTALQFALDKRPGLRQAWRFGRTRLASLAAAPTAPLAIALLLGLPIVLLGALGNIPYAGELLTGLLLPLALILTPFIAVILIGSAAGLNLMFPAIAYEDSDFFDAIGRSLSNVYNRPWRMGFYMLVAAVYGAACYLFVRLFAFLVLWLTRGFLQIGLDNEKLQAIWPQPSFDNLLGTATAAPETWSLWLGALLVRIWVLVVAGVVVSFVVSFYFTAGTIIYALMRNRVDGTPLDEVYEAAGETVEDSGPPASLPPEAAPDQGGPSSATSE